jgi:hypothetical protein
MTVKLVRSASLYKDVPYAYASVAPRGSLIFTAGACPLDDQGEVVGAGDVRAQASLAVANLATVLAESGATVTPSRTWRATGTATSLFSRNPSCSWRELPGLLGGSVRFRRSDQHVSAQPPDIPVAAVYNWVSQPRWPTWSGVDTGESAYLTVASSPARWCPSRPVLSGVAELIGHWRGQGPS